MSALAGAYGVTRRFGETVAVDDVTLEVAPGEVVGLLGANGAGKTTLVRILLGLMGPSEGRVELFGAAPSRATRRRLGYVPQGLGLYDDLTPRENLAFARAVYGNAGVTALPEEPPVAVLPLGRQRQVAFLEALDHRPELLVLDEPTSGVGPLGAARLWDRVLDAAEAGAGVLVTTHSLEEAEECDRLVVMTDGRVVASGTPSDIVGRARVVEVEVADWVRAFTALGKHGLHPSLVGTRLRVPGADLEAVRAALDDPSAVVTWAGATLEERFVELSAVPS